MGRSRQDSINVGLTNSHISLRNYSSSLTLAAPPAAIAP